jgi:proline iminopeptidase
LWSQKEHRQFFDPAFYRIIVFDQRGAGRSTPLAETNENTTHHLLSDIEKLRTILHIEKWLVFGGSWGSTLALLYAEQHPERIVGLILRGIFLCRKSEIDWFLHGIREIFPDYWEEFVSIIPREERHDLLEAYHRLLEHPDAATRLKAAHNYLNYEDRCSTLLPGAPIRDQSRLDTVALGLATMEVHYFRHKIFLEENHILQNVKNIRTIPGMIVQGRYDMVCPPRSAFDLHKAWPEAEFKLVSDAGHSAFEPTIRAELISATERFKKLF